MREPKLLQKQVKNGKLNKKFVQFGLKNVKNRDFYQNSHFFAYFLRNKRDFSAKSLSLLLLALRPRLLNFAKNGRLLVKNRHISAKNAQFCTNFLPKSSKIRNFFPINRKIVDTSTILIVLSVIFSGFLTKNVAATSITLKIPESLSVNITPSASAQYKKSENGNITVSSDAPFGYNLSIKVKDSVNGNNLMNGSHKLASIGTNLAESAYQNSGAVNSWGYIPSKFSGVANTDVRPGPTTGDTIEKTSGPSTGDNNYTIALATKIDSTLAAGKYSNTFVIAAVANSVSYSITYNLNSGSWTGTSPQTGSTPENKVRLSSVAPTRANYTFEGWCTTSTSNETCSGTKYSPGADYPLNSGANTVNLYAMWKSAKPATPTTMQNFGSYCEWMSEHQTLNLTDSRDNKTYKVAKLKDNKCWMVENLRLVGRRTLTSSDSDVSSSFSLPASISSGFDSTTAANIHLDSTYGGYYNYAAATAGTNPSSGKASSSICPKGWHLPTGGNTSSDFAKLTKAYGGSGDNEKRVTAVRNALMATPAPGFVYSGYYYSSSLSLTGSEGDWWSSTAYGSDFAYFLSLDINGYVYPLNGSGKNRGCSVRCVAG